MKNLKRIFVLLIISSLAFTSCEKDNKKACNFDAAYEEYYDKVTQYVEDPGNNCRMIMNAAKTFLDKVGDCPNVDKSIIASAKAQINDLDCNQY